MFPLLLVTERLLLLYTCGQPLVFMVKPLKHPFFLKNFALELDVMVEVQSVTVHVSLNLTTTEVDFTQLLDHLYVIFSNAPLPISVTEAYSCWYAEN